MCHAGDSAFIGGEGTGEGYGVVRRVHRVCPAAPGCGGGTRAMVIAIVPNRRGCDGRRGVEWRGSVAVFGPVAQAVIVGVDVVRVYWV